MRLTQYLFLNGVYVGRSLTEPSTTILLPDHVPVRANSRQPPLVGVAGYPGRPSRDAYVKAHKLAGGSFPQICQRI